MEEIEHSKFTTMIQTLIDPSSGVKAFKEYFDIAFPYIKSSEAKKSMDAVEAMRKFCSTPLKVEKLRMGVRSRMSRDGRIMGNKVLSKIGGVTGT